jgi:hypothetical protein
MPSPTDFNLSPYYDDYAESKKFHRILFRPAFAVQARELTQSQSILQNQVERVSDHLFEKGAMVIPGEIGYDLAYYAVKLTSKTGTLSSYEGVTLTGGTSGVVATVVKTSATDGTDPDTLFVKYTKTGTNNSDLVFADGETITGTAADSSSLSAVVNTTATGSAAEIQAGVYYINGFHVQVDNQTLILDKYTNTPSYRVGLTISESFVTPSDDTSLNDNAQGSSNANAPGAHRFKINLTLSKLSLTSTEDSNFIELLRLSSGIIQNQVRTTEYSVLEDTFARRTFDESGDYVVRNFDIDIRESAISGNNRGIYTNGATTVDGGTASNSKLAIGLAPGKAYVKGYEIETVGTTFKDVNKARDFDTQSNFGTRFDVANFVNVTNVFGTPDIGFVSGDVEAYKRVNLYSEASASRGTENTGTGSSINTIGRAKSRGFEYSSGTASSNVFSSSSLTSAVFKHYLFDMNLFTYLNIKTAQSFTTGETITGGTSGATGTLESISTTETATITGISQANPAVVTASNNFREGQQVTIAGVSGMTQVNNNVYTVRNPSSSNFQLYDSSDGTSVDSSGFSSYSSGGTAAHGVVILSSVNGTFSAGETITGGTSSNTAVIQSDAVGLKGVTDFDFPQVKHLGMAGSPTYTSDTLTDSVSGANLVLTGSLSVSGSAAAVTGFNTKFTTQLKIGDSISFTNDSGNTETKIVEAIISDTSLTLSSNVAATSTKTIATRLRAKLQNADKNISIFELPYKTIKTLLTASNSGISDTSFSVRRHFTATLSSGSATITAGTNETFASLAEGDYSVSVMTSSGSAVQGDVLSLSGSGVFTLGGSPTGKTLTLDFGSGYSSAKIKILATVNRTTVGSKTKTLNEDETLQVTSQATIESGTVGLGKADVFKLNKVYMAANFSTNATASDTDITSRFDLDTGQRDNFYDIGRIKLKSGEITPTGRLLVDFDYFSHGSGDFFSVDSYSGVVDYENIPQYTSDTTGKTYELRDVLDFRPRVDDASTINSGGQDRSYDGTGASTIDIVKFNSDVSTDHEYYLPRIDKIFLDKDGNFKVIEGASSLNPQVPNDLEGAMHLYTLKVPAYTLSTDDVDIETVDNRRFTMRDIGNLEKRIENVEYYTQLNLLEQSAQSTQIQDAEGFDRFKNGFIVDNFTGHGIGDVGNIDYRASIDMSGGELRPMHNTDAVQLIERDDDGTAILAADRTAANYAKTGDLITLPFTETNLITQAFASKTVNVNPFEIFTWAGSVGLTPPGDEWKETKRLPEILTNTNGAFDSVTSNLRNSNLASNPLGTIWNEWQDFWTGRPITSTQSRTRRVGRRLDRVTAITTTRQTVQTRTAIRTRLVSNTIRDNLQGRLVTINILPFIRNRTISFSATRMKPNTRVYPYFDNVDISSYVTPTGGSLGGNIVTDTNGACSGTFTMPDPTVDSNPRWSVGNRVFRLTSSATNTSVVANVETSAEANYIARGVLGTENSTREFSLVRESTVDTRQITRTSTRETSRVIGWVDPLAQSFLIDDTGGVFVTSVDLFFSSKDSSIPVTIQIREMVNGYPGPRIVPFSEVTLNPGSINTTSDASTATNFAFPSPVYLEENKEYCFVVLSNSNNYLVYVSRLGETVIGSDRTISQQPYAGTLFKSQNGSTWTAEQNEDIKFTLKRAEFENVTGEVTLTNDTLPSRTLKTNPLRTTNSSGVIRVFHPNHGMHGTDNNVTISGVASGTYNGISHSDINGTYTSISNITLDSYDITTSGTANATGDVGGATVVATQNRLYDVLHLSLGTMNVPGTNTTYSLRPTSGKSVNGSESEFSLSAATNAVSVIANDNIYFTAPNMVASEINETNEMSGQKSMFVTLTMTTENTKLSPVLDVQRMSAFTIQNRLNSHTSSNHPDYVADTANTGTTSEAVYITRPIVLDNNSTALDVRLTQNVRSSSEVRVYFRVSSSEEVRNINDLSWTPFNSDGSEDTTVIPAEDDETFNEYKYSASGIHDFTAFQIKIVMKGSISSYPPVIRDLRGIALAV